MAIGKQLIGYAAEFAVASELCRRGLYAQLTLGMKKRTDILVEDERGMLRVQVKSKRSKVWPNCTGIYGERIVLILVDFQNKGVDKRPDFYILTVKDWREFLEEQLAARIASGEVIIDDQNVPNWVRQGSYRGHSFPASEVRRFRERWDKIAENVR